MGNPISKKMKVGTIGEILVQVRLLQYNVQAAPPIKDSGNDLIAIKGDCFRAIQIKTTSNDVIFINKVRLPKKWHLLGLVFLKGEDDQIFLDKSVVKLIPRDLYEQVGFKMVRVSDLKDWDISSQCVDHLFSKE